MENLDKRGPDIIIALLQKPGLSSSEIYNELLRTDSRASLVTIKRSLSKLAVSGRITGLGAGRSTVYEIMPQGRIFAEIDAKDYCATEPDKRYGLSRYNFDLLSNCPHDIFTESELMRMDNATSYYHQRTADLPPAIAKKELQRLIIELSWKSSKIEGNTYTLLDTEKLILENQEAPGHDRKETQMILNHKEAFNFIHENAKGFKQLTRANLEHLHEILVKDMDVGRGLRRQAVGVTGSKYQPLDNIHQIIEAVSELSAAVARMKTPYAKALIALLGVSYIQPFEDGNKRTARLFANAILLAHQCAPLSYRSVNENEYREAMLVFYEINSLIPAKRIFIDQYEFAASNYLTK